MIDPRWRKVFRDLWGNPARTVLVVLSIAVGVFAVGMILSTNAVLGRDLNRNYMQANPSAASIYTDGFDDDFVAAIRHVPGVADAEGRYSTTVRIRLSANSTRSLAIVFVPSHGKTKINHIWPQTDQFPPAAREIAMERASLEWLGLKVGDRITVETADAKIRELKIGGSVHYINLPPASFVGTGYAFATADTLEWLGAGRQYTELQLTVSEDPMNKAHIQDVAAKVRSRVESTGRRVYYTYIPEPGKYPGDAPVQALLMLLGLLGLLSLVLSGFLVVNTISALLAQQTRQIGVMKAIGASDGQVRKVFVIESVIIGLLSWLIGALIAAPVSRLMSDQVGILFTQSPLSYSFSATGAVGWLVAVLVIAALASILPARRASQLTVRDVLSFE